MRKQADEVKAIADDAQRDLDIAMPALESISADGFLPFCRLISLMQRCCLCGQAKVP